MITRINESKTLISVYHANENVNLMIENVIQVKSAITINVDVSVKLRKTSCVQKRLYLESHYM